MSPESKPTRPLDIYVRVSRVGGRQVEEEGGTAAEQERRCRASLESKDLKAGKVFKDLDQSGGKTSRPAFDKAKARIASGESGGIIFLNLSRFGRNRNVAGDILALEELGATVISVEDNIDTSTASGQLMLDVMTAFNTYYLANVRQQSAGTRTRMVAKKIHGGGYVPVGYRRREDRILEPDPKTAPIVRQAFELRAKGASWGKLAEFLTESAMPTSRGSDKWTRAAARTVILNRAYLGEAQAGADNVNKEAHEALVSPALWRSAQRGAGTHAAGPGRDSGALLRGLLRCECGNKLRSDTYSYQGTRRAMYRCHTKDSTLKCSAPVTIARDVIEPYVLEQILPLWRGTELRRATGADPKLEAARIELADAEAELEAVESVPVKEIGLERLTRMLRERERAASEAQERLAALETASDASKMLESLGDVSSRPEFDALPIAERRALLRVDVERIIIKPGRSSVAERAEIVWRKESA